MSFEAGIKPEIEVGLLAQAHARGLSLDAYLDELLRSAAAAKPRPASLNSLAQLFAESGLKGRDLKFERNPVMGRTDRRAMRRTMSVETARSSPALALASTACLLRFLRPCIREFSLKQIASALTHFRFTEATLLLRQIILGIGLSAPFQALLSH